MIKPLDVAILVSAVLSITACTTTSIVTEYEQSDIGFSRLTQSHFTYPNSNVIPIGMATGKSHKTGSLNDFPRIDQASLEAMDAAIQSKSEADMLINATTSGVLLTTTTITTTQFHTYPPKTDFDIKYDLDFTITGTAVKMEVGKQILN